MAATLLIDAGIRCRNVWRPSTEQQGRAQPLLRIAAQIFDTVMMIGVIFVAIFNPVSLTPTAQGVLAGGATLILGALLLASKNTITHNHITNNIEAPQHSVLPGMLSAAAKIVTTGYGAVL